MPETATAQKTLTNTVSTLSPLDAKRRQVLEEMNEKFVRGDLNREDLAKRARLEKIVLSQIKSSQQVTFYKAKLDLAIMDQIETTRKLTYAEKARRNDTLEDLWSLIRLFGISEAQKRMRKYRLDNDAYSDVQQLLSEIFFERLPFYNPLWTAPTTYFVPYFNQAITDYILSFSQHLTQYDAKNVGILRRAIYYFESKGIKWDESMIVDRTGLSPKVVKQTLQIANNSIRANIDDVGPGLADKIRGPEEQFLDDECRSDIADALKNTLTRDELEFFLTRINLDGRREVPYQVLAETKGISIREAKRKWSSIVAKLNTNKKLEVYRREKIEHDGSSTHLDLQTRAGEEAEKQFMNFMGELYQSC